LNLKLFAGSGQWMNMTELTFVSAIIHVPLTLES
jgi:hypothetical protein